MSDSPRVDYAVLPATDSAAGPWQEFCPRPAVLGPFTMLRRLLWNPQWNETLFLVSLAERLISATTAETELHSERELLLRVARHLHRQKVCDDRAYLQIRLRLVGASAGASASASAGRIVGRGGSGDEVVSQVAYVSALHPIAGLITP